MIHQRSPLSLATHDPTVNAFICYLDDMRASIESNPQQKHELRFAQGQLATVREAFRQSICRGESRLHQLCQLLAGWLFDDDYLLKVVVIGDCNDERFTLSQSLTQEVLYAETDLDLGNRIVQGVRLRDGNTWREPTLVANFVEYQPTQMNRYGVHKMISRIKAEEELWNKVVDEIFDIDSLVQRDKKLRALSRYVKDIFGVKIVAEDPDRVRDVHEKLIERQFSDEELQALGVNPADGALEFLEVKNYLGVRERKNSGWKAIKSVVRWVDQTFEVQVQPLGNYVLEREYLTQESHEGFKRVREQVRDDLAHSLPLFGFYRDLVHWLFMPDSRSAPEFEGVRIVVE